MNIENYDKRMIVYHGTNATFDEFDIIKKGENTEYNNTIHGIFFTDKYENAKLFGERIIQAEITMHKTLDLRLEGIFNIKEQAGDIIEIVFGEKIGPEDALEKLNEDISLGEIADFYDALHSDYAADKLRSLGYDSIISNLGSGNDEYIVFNTSQIRQIDKNFEKPQLIQLNFNKINERRLSL
ncbi:hypothetical protein [Pedobacter jeongneungensis]|uniref:ADP-ribosyltransferase-containing protein n=1 Tax=Pedobacter jeongneungensis TaxID=947309 RepID=UPI0004697A57|nr:hypothetical protein [Pedobacter jeongneungensis]